MARLRVDCDVGEWSICDQRGHLGASTGLRLAYSAAPRNEITLQMMSGELRLKGFAMSPL
jgi:hypothetical protein